MVLQNAKVLLACIKKSKIARGSLHIKRIFTKCTSIRYSPNELQFICHELPQVLVPTNQVYNDHMIKPLQVHCKIKITKFHYLKNKMLTLNTRFSVSPLIIFVDHSYTPVHITREPRWYWTPYSSESKGRKSQLIRRDHTS